MQDSPAANGGAQTGVDMKRVVTLAQRTGANLYHFGEQTVAGLFSSGSRVAPVGSPAPPPVATTLIARKAQYDMEGNEVRVERTV